MRTSLFALATAIVITFVPPGFGADDLAWGPTVNGLRLGIAFGADPSKPTLRAAWQNVGSKFREVLIGYEAGGLVYNSLKIVATAPDGKQQELLQRNSDLPLANRILPVSIPLKVGATHEVELPLTDYASPTMVTLDVLVRQGYSVRVHFEGKRGATWAERLDAPIGTLHEDSWAKRSPTWIGMLSSAEISSARWNIHPLSRGDGNRLHVRFQIGTESLSFGRSLCRRSALSVHRVQEQVGLKLESTTGLVQQIGNRRMWSDHRITSRMSSVT